MLSENTFLYAAAGYLALNSATFTFAPQVPITDSFGEVEAKMNKPLKVMTEVTGAVMAMSGVTAFCLARGVPPATAVHCGISIMPIRMAYDAFISKVMPPPPVIAMTAGIVIAGMLVAKK